jgi:hypothetical protein
MVTFVQPPKSITSLTPGFLIKMLIEQRDLAQAQKSFLYNRFILRNGEQNVVCLKD